MLASFQTLITDFVSLETEFNELKTQVNTEGQHTDSHEHIKKFCTEFESLNQSLKALKEKIDGEQDQFQNMTVVLRSTAAAYEYEVKMIAKSCENLFLQLQVVNAEVIQQGADRKVGEMKLQSSINQVEILKTDIDSQDKLLTELAKQIKELNTWREGFEEERKNQSKEIEKEKTDLLNQIEENAEVMKTTKIEMGKLKDQVDNLQKEYYEEEKTVKTNMTELEERLRNLEKQFEDQKKEEEKAGVLGDLGLRTKSLLALIFKKDPFIELRLRDVEEILKDEENKSKLIALKIFHESDREVLLTAISKFTEERMIAAHPAIYKKTWNPEYLKGLADDMEEKKQIELCIQIFEVCLAEGTPFGEKKAWILKNEIKY